MIKLGVIGWYLVMLCASLNVTRGALEPKPREVWREVEREGPECVELSKLLILAAAVSSGLQVFHTISLSSV